MATLAILAAAAGTLSEHAKAVARVAGERVGLGSNSAPRYTSPDGKVWQIYDDNRFTLDDCARAAVLMRNIGTVPAGLPETKEAVIAWIDSIGVVIPQIADGADPWAVTLAANNAPSAVKMFGSVPPDWKPVSE